MWIQDGRHGRRNRWHAYNICWGGWVCVCVCVCGWGAGGGGGLFYAAIVLVAARETLLSERGCLFLHNTPLRSSVINAQLLTLVVSWVSRYPHVDGFVRERRNSIANTLELCLSCTNPSMYQRQFHNPQEIGGGHGEGQYMGIIQGNGVWRRTMWLMFMQAAVVENLVQYMVTMTNWLYDMIFFTLLHNSSKRNISYSNR